MTQFILKATIAMVVPLIAVAVFRHSRASIRHALLSAMFILLLLLPFWSMLMPKVDIPVQAPSGVVHSSRETGATARETGAAAALASPASNHIPAIVSEPARSFEFRAIGITIYASVVSFLLLSLALGMWRLRFWASEGEVWLDGTRLASEISCANSFRGAVLVVLSDNVRVPMTFGFRRQTILLPAIARSWDDEALRRALCHELEHVRRDDWGLQLIALAVSAIYWPHPLVWVALRRFRVEAERACDDAVLRSFEPSSYASQLVSLARSLKGTMREPAMAMASPTQLTERVRAILDTTQERGPHGRSATIFIAVAMLCGLGVFGSLQLVAQVTRDKIERGVKGGVRQSVEGGVKGGVEGGVEGGVQGGVSGGVDEGVDGGFEDAYRDVVVAASETGNTDLLSRLLDQGLKINKPLVGDGTPILIAARSGRMAAVRFLLDRGADPNVPSPGDGNALIAAAQFGQTEIVQLLLDNGARVDDVVPGDENALMGASEGGHADIVRLLIARGADVNLRVWVGDHGGEWRTPLLMARRGGNSEVVDSLIEAGARD